MTESFLPNQPPNSDPASLIAQVNNIVYSIDKIKSSWRAFRENHQNRNTFTITVTSSDSFYYQLQNWLIKQIRVDNQKSVKGYGTSKGLSFMFDDSNAQWIDVDGHKIKVSSEKPKSGMESFKEELLGDVGASSPYEPQLVLIAQSKDGFFALKEKLTEVREKAIEDNVDPPYLHTLNGFYGESISVIRSRPLSSVVLADGQIERIVKDLDQFLKDEEVYIERGIPYQRGYLLYGPPGTGKTSLVKALAHHFHLDMYYIPLGTIGSDGELNKAVARVGEKAITLFEDVDVFSGVKDRTVAKERTFSLSGFLNILDGAMTPHGMIKIMTTNDKSVLDPAVMRPGRVDLVEELGPLRDKQADRLFESFYKRSPSSPLGLEGIAPAMMIEVMKSHMYDPQTAEEQIREMIK